jgi:hypothetical protein
MVPKMPATIAAANSKIRSRLDARCAARGGSASSAKRWVRCDEAVACRNSAGSGTASLAVLKPTLGRVPSDHRLVAGEFAT